MRIFSKNSQPKFLDEPSSKAERRLSPSASVFRACRGFICATFCNFAVRIRKKQYNEDRIKAMDYE